jgi:hypothetical protein
VKFEHWHFNSDFVCGDTIDRYPILDWSWFYNPRSFDYGFRNIEGRNRHGFTGKYYKIFNFELILFRHAFGFRIEWAHGETTPEDAKAQYHARIKERNNGKV